MRRLGGLNLVSSGELLATVLSGRETPRCPHQANAEAVLRAVEHDDLDEVSAASQCPARRLPWVRHFGFRNAGANLSGIAPACLFDPEPAVVDLNLATDKIPGAWQPVDLINQIN